jgi:hypothetical protein
MDYQDCYTLVNTGEKLIAITYSSNELHNMFTGPYNTTFNGVPIDYSV